MLYLVHTFLILMNAGADAPGETAYIHPAMLAPAPESAPTAPQPLPTPLVDERAAWKAQSHQRTLDRLDSLLSDYDPFVASGSPAMAPFLTERERSAATVLERMNRSGTAQSQVQALEVSGDVEDAEEILQLLMALQGADPASQRWAARSLETSDSHALAAAVLDLLAATPHERRQQVFDLLPHLPDSMEEPMLQVLTEEAAPHRAQFAAQCLGKLGSARAVPILTERAWASEPETAYAYAYALWLARAPEALPAWHDLLQHHEPAVRALAQEALISMGAEAEVQAVADAAAGVTESDVQLQIRAVQWLGSLNEPFLIPLLVDVMEKNRYIRAEAGQVLRQKTGAQVENDPAKWREWMRAVEQMNTPPLVPSQEKAP